MKTEEGQAQQEGEADEKENQEWPALVCGSGETPQGTVPSKKDLWGQRSVSDLLKGAQKYMDYVKEDEILVYPGTFEAIESRTISMVAMDIRSGKLANATQKKKKQWRKCCPL